MIFEGRFEVGGYVLLLGGLRSETGNKLVVDCCRRRSTKAWVWTVLGGGFNGEDGRCLSGDLWLRRRVVGTTKVEV